MAFDFTNQGLTLIQGATGSGKSTLCDVIPWILFGKTAKNGTVDEIRAWGVDEPTTGSIIILNTPNGDLQIVRTRGAKANDLYYKFVDLNDAPEERGKDLNDTQKIINSLLGMDCDLYLAGAYFHEFSQTAQFFTTTPKNRRTICEQLVDLSLAKKLQANISLTKKQLESEQSEIQEQLNATKTAIATIEKFQESGRNKAANWIMQKANRKKILENTYDSFDSDKELRIKALERRQEMDILKDKESERCSACGSIKTKKHNNIEHIKQKYAELIEQEKCRENPYLQQLADLELETNPYEGWIEDLTELEEKRQLLESIQKSYDLNNLHLEDFELLQEVVADYRSTTITNTISNVETQTDQLLEDHFDSECKVSFTIEDADKVNVTIHKNGNMCNYTQLSKGQRCLLKLCFGVAVMNAVSNHSGIKFHQVFFDEALDGLDEVFKAKAYGLLSTLEQEYESIFVVEHSEGLKSMFTNQFIVELINGNSEIHSG